MADLSKTERIVNDVLEHAWREYGKLHLLRPACIASKSTLFQNVSRCPIVRVAERIQLQNAESRRDVDHGRQCFRGKASSPGVLCEHIAGRGSLRRFEPKASTPDHQPVAKPPYHVRAAGPPFPACRA